MYTCERCKELVPHVWHCDFCGRLVCERCKKAARRHKGRLIIICKDCWNVAEKRKEYKKYNAPGGGE